MKVTCERASWDQCRECGERRKSRDHDLRASCGFVDDPLARSCIIRFFARGRDAITDSDGRRDLGIGSKETEGSWSNSLISLIVNAAWYLLEYTLNYRPA